MATKTNTRKQAKRIPRTQPNDGAYFLKLVMYTIVGTQWVWFESSSGTVPLPAGLLIGLMFAMHEHFRVDRKIEFAVLLAAMLAGFGFKIGIFITV